MMDALEIKFAEIDDPWSKDPCGVYNVFDTTKFQAPGQMKVTALEFIQDTISKIYRARLELMPTRPLDRLPV
jgi:hypothetical protein